MILSFLLASALAAPAQDPADELVRLRDGRLLVGLIETHDLDGFVLSEARTGGQYRLSWGDLFPGEAERLRTDFGYADATEVPMTTASRLLLTNGRELVGRILREDDRQIELRRRETTTIVPLQNLAAPPEPVTIEAAEVLTPEQFYAERLPQVAADDAYAQFTFAQELEVMFALDQAKVHFELAGELAAAEGDGPLGQRVAGALTQLETTIANRDEAEYLEGIRTLMHRDRFTEAKAQLASFESEFPDAALRGEYLQLEDLFGERQEIAVVEYLERHWFNRTVKLLKRKALEKDAPVDEMIAYIEGELPLLIRAAMLEELQGIDDQLDITALDGLWARRLDIGASLHSAGFGDGTWILGEDKARAGLVEEKEDANDGKTDQQREMEERMKRYLDNLEAQRRAASSGDSEARPEDWWRRASVSQRFQWLLAYYAEFSGDYKLVNVNWSYCPTCAGAGFIETLDVTADGSNNRRSKCPTCHGVQVRRGISFR
jgi:hypothetical protein